MRLELATRLPPQPTAADGRPDHPRRAPNMMSSQAGTALRRRPEDGRAAFGATAGGVGVASGSSRTGSPPVEARSTGVLSAETVRVSCSSGPLVAVPTGGASSKKARPSRSIRWVGSVPGRSADPSTVEPAREAGRGSAAGVAALAAGAPPGTLPAGTLMPGTPPPGTPPPGTPGSNRVEVPADEPGSTSADADAAAGEGRSVVLVPPVLVPPVLVPPVPPVLVPVALEPVALGRVTSSPSSSPTLRPARTTSPVDRPP